ncbi:MAG: YfhO family protein [Myxococcales bacterium]|nr:YfhO family protein [Myxococcales bacterium]
MAHSEQSLSASARHHFARNAAYYLVPMLYSLAIFYLYREVFSGEKGFGWDSTESYWPDLVYFSESLAQGEWPLWNPYDRGGYPYSSDPQPGMFYPLHWILAGASAVTGDTGWSLIQFKMLLHHVIAGVCMHAFLRYRSLPHVAAAVGGLALVASSPFLIHKASNLLMPMVWTPLIWMATDALLKAPNWRRALALAASLYVSGSAGSPPGFFYVLVMALLYGGFRIVETALAKRRDGELAAFLWKIAPLLVLAALVVFGLLWVSVAPGLSLSEHTPRVKRDLAYALSIPLPMWPTLSSLLVPTSGQVDAYCGILVLLLAVSAVLLRPRQHRGTPIFFAVASVLFLCMSFGDQLPVLGFFVKHIPGFGMFRIASRYKCLFAVTMAPLAGYGAWALLAARPRWSRDTWKIIGLCIVSTAGIAMLLHWLPLDAKLTKRFPGPATPIVLSTLAMGLLVASVLHTRRSAVYLVAVMPLLITGDSERYWHHQQLFLEVKVDHKEDLAKIADLKGVLDHRVRIYDEFVLEQRPGSRLRIRDFRGYPSGDPLDFQRYRDVLARARKEPRLLEAYNVGYVLHGRHHRSGKRSNRLKVDPAIKAKTHFERGKGQTRRALHPAPIVQWYQGARFVPKGKALNAVLEAESDTGVRRFAVLEPSDGARIEPSLRAKLETVGEAGGATASGELVSFEADEVTISIDAPDHGLLVLNEVFYPGWEVSIDGKPADALRANYLLRATTVGPGRHIVRWRYNPVGHGPRILLYLLCMLTLLAGLVPWGRIRQRLRK